MDFSHKIGAFCMFPFIDVWKDFELGSHLKTFFPHLFYVLSKGGKVLCPEPFFPYSLSFFNLSMDPNTPLMLVLGFVVFTFGEIRKPKKIILQCWYWYKTVTWLKRELLALAFNVRFISSQCAVCLFLNTKWGSGYEVVRYWYVCLIIFLKLRVCWIEI